MSFDVASFLRRYARDYTDVDELYRKAKKLGIVENREKFQSTIEDSFLDGSYLVICSWSYRLRGTGRR